MTTRFAIGSKVTARQGGNEMPGTITGRHGSTEYYAVRLDNGELIYQWGNDLKQRKEEHAQTKSKEEGKKMLRSNSKQARENIRAYIVDHFDGTNYAPDFDYIEQAQKDTAQGIRNVDIFSMVAHAIAATFYDEKCRFDNRFKAGRISRYELFEDWCAGLPSILDTCYYYNRSAVDDLGAILEESDEEKAKFTEQQAEKRLTQLIYREIYSMEGVA